MAGVDPKEMYAYLVSHGANANEATMLTAAAGAESRWNPNATHDKDSNGNPTGYGMFGHRLDRLQGMRDQYGLQYPNWQQQSLYSLGEVRKNRTISNAVNSATTPRELTVAQMHFERPRGYTADNPTAGDNFSGRLNLTQRISNGNFADATGAPGKTVMDPNNPSDPNNPANQLDPSAHNSWQNIFAQSQGQQPNMQQQPGQGGGGGGSKTPSDIHGSAMGAIASGLQQGMESQGNQPPLLARMMFGDKGIQLPNANSIPTPNGGRGMLAGLSNVWQGNGTNVTPTPSPADQALASNAPGPQGALPSGNNIPQPPQRPADLAQPQQQAQITPQQQLPSMAQGGQPGGGFGSLFGGAQPQITPTNFTQPGQGNDAGGGGFNSPFAGLFGGGDNGGDSGGGLGGGLGGLFGGLFG